MHHAIDMPLCPRSQDAVLPPSLCRAAPTGSGIGEPMPSDAMERLLVTVLRCLSAARETGDAICWEEALDRAEQVFGPREGSLVVARAAALQRCLAGSDAVPHFLPLPCRRLSRGEADLLKLFQASIGSQHRAEAADMTSVGSRLSLDTRKALADVADAVRSSRSAGLGLRPAA